MSDLPQCPFCRRGVIENDSCSYCSISVVQISELRQDTPNDIAPHDGAPPLLDHPDQAPAIQLPSGKLTVIDVREQLRYNEFSQTRHQLWIWCPHKRSEVFVHVRHASPSDVPITLGGQITDFGVMCNGDLLTLGPYAWILHEYASGHGYGLEPANPFNGTEIELEDVVVKDRLQIPNLLIAAGAFVGIVGESGSGKSTLINEIAGKRVGSGTVRIGGVDRADVIDPAVTQVAYLPQADLVHPDLTVEQQTLDYVRILRPGASDAEVKKALQVVGLRRCLSQYPSALSGGQLRRMRLAAALARRPSILLLDEPDSGLDPETASDIRRLLHTFGLLGATVVVVTHHRLAMERFHRVIEIEHGSVVNDEQSDTAPRYYDRTTKPLLANDKKQATFISQLRLLVQRECLQFMQRKFLSWTTSRGSTLTFHQFWLALLVPLLFAGTLAMAAPTSELEPHLVGFLCVLSAIWMSASQSYLALTNSWQRIKFELRQGLGFYPYLLSKSLFLFVISAVQTAIFLLTLTFIRHYYLGVPVFLGEVATTSDDSPSTRFAEWDTHWLSVFLCLLAVTWAASQLGLLISAAARSHVTVAATWLLLVMMCQIVLSPFVVRAKHSDQTLENCYRGFWLHDRCDGNSQCPSRMVAYEAGQGYLCSSCSQAPVPELSESERMFRTSENKEKPTRVSIWGSYLTLTRYADLAVRPIVGYKEEATHAARFAYQSTRWWGVISLVIYGLVCHIFISLLNWRSFWRPRRYNLRSKPLAACLIGVAFSGMSTACCAEEPTVVVKLPIENDHYDARRFLDVVKPKANTKSTQINPRDTERAVWIPLTTKTRLALLLLQQQKVIKRYAIDARELNIEFDKQHFKDIRSVVFPPSLLAERDPINSPNIVIFVHGLEGGADTFQGYSSAFTQRGWRSLRLVYPNDSEVSTPAKFLSQEILRLAADMPEGRIVVIAHSLGGLLALEALSSLALDSRHVSDLVVLGTPFKGSSLTEFHAELELFEVIRRLKSRDWTAMDIEKDGRGEAIELLRIASLTRERILQQKRPRHLRVHLIAGDKAPLMPADQTQLKQAFEDSESKQSLPPLLKSQIESLVTADELVEGRGDSAVTVASATSLPGAASVRIFHRTHSGLLSLQNDQDEVLTWIFEKLK